MLYLPFVEVDVSKEVLVFHAGQSCKIVRWTRAIEVGLVVDLAGCLR